MQQEQAPHHAATFFLAATEREAGAGAVSSSSPPAAAPGQEGGPSEQEEVPRGFRGRRDGARGPGGVAVGVPITHQPSASAPGEAVGVPVTWPDSNRSSPFVRSPEIAAPATLPAAAGDDENSETEHPLRRDSKSSQAAAATGQEERPAELGRRVTAVFIPVEAPPPESSSMHEHAAGQGLHGAHGTPGQQDVVLTLRGRDGRVLAILPSGSPHLGAAMLISSASAHSRGPTLVAQRLPDGTVIVQEIPVYVPYRCTCGWMLFAAGFMLPLCWLVGTFLPFCSEEPNDRRAAICSSVAFVVFVFLIIGLAATTH